MEKCRGSRKRKIATDRVFKWDFRTAHFSYFKNGAHEEAITVWEMK